MAMVSQVLYQTLSAIVTIVWSAVISVVLLLIIKATVGLRVEQRTENEGLDINEHGESGYNELGAA
jgi:Amt family ammonium transporter